jgi:hypothetical protein
MRQCKIDQKAGTRLNVAFGRSTGHNTSKQERRDVGRVLFELEIGVWYYCDITNDVSLFSDPSPWNV